MAIFHITPAKSVFKDDGTNAFEGDNPGPDTLIVDPDAYLISTNFGNGALLAATGAWTVNLNGSIVSQNHVGIVLAAGNPAVSTINIGVNGGVHGATGISVGSPANINNAGTIDAEGIMGGVGILISDSGTNTITNSGKINGLFGFSIEVTGTSTDKVHNSGSIDGSVALSGGNDTVTNSGLLDGFTLDLGNGTNRLINSGQLDGQHVLGGSGADTVSNSGFVFSPDVQLGDGINHLTNSGRMEANIRGGNDKDIIVNSGTMPSGGGGVGDVSLGDGNNTLINSGAIEGSVMGGTGADTVANFGSLSFVQLGEGANHLTSAGKIDGGIAGGSDADTFTNSGKITGDIFSGSGADTVTDFAIVGGVMQSGTIDGKISLGDGDDTFTGGANSEEVVDGNGADIVNLGGGPDTYIATGSTGSDGIDVIHGGPGRDTYGAGAATNAVTINLGSVSFDLGLVPANTATGSDVAGTQKDAIFGFEDADGGAGNDIIDGSAANNVLTGGAGNDFLFGLGGNDSLFGGDGNDELVGGSGSDHLSGGSGANVFQYNALSDSGITAATRDVIAFFQEGIDTIDLSHIDANTKTPGTNDAFHFIGTNVTFEGQPGGPQPGALRAFWTAISQIIEGDVNGDAKADFSIELSPDPRHSITLASTDFKL